MCSESYKNNLILILLIGINILIVDCASLGHQEHHLQSQNQNDEKTIITTGDINSAGNIIFTC